MHVQFLGAAQTVTGSMHLVEVAGTRLLLDCGLFQGRRQESIERNRTLPIDARSIDHVVLSHAHIDHSGALPTLLRHGFTGRIFTTPATADLADAMLRDAASIQRSDADYLNRRRVRMRTHEPEFAPLYEMEDAIAAIERLTPLEYHAPRDIAPGVRLTFFDAGHVLGSAIVALDLEEAGVRKRLVFSGDLGRPNAPILRDPETLDGADVLLVESTYGDRLHEPYTEMDDRLAAIITRTFARGGKVLVPSFALERAQEVLHSLTRLQLAGKLGPIPIYVDSPLTVRLTQVFQRHTECFDSETLALMRSGRSPFDPQNVRYVSDVEESKAIDASDEPCVIVSASGMCEAGRIVHHLRASLDDPRSTVVIVGFMAQHTLGRRLVERRDHVRIFGVEHERRIGVELLAGFSAHADQADLRGWVSTMRARGHSPRIALVHGEPAAQRVLCDLLVADGATSVTIPAPGDVLTI